MLEDMLRMYVIDKPSKLKDYLHLVDFGYNNGHHTSLIMSPFEALYGNGCISLVSWDNPVDRVVLGLDMLKEMEFFFIKIM